jgi:tetratricopeptide (TPR) repeat protein
MTRPALFALLALTLLLGACVSPPEQRPEAVLQGQRFLELGVQAYRGDDYANAATHFTKALAHYQGLDDRGGILRSRLNLAETALVVGNPAAAERHLDAAAALAQAEGEGDALRRVALLRSTLALKAGEYDGAAALLEPLLAGKDDVARTALANRVAVALARRDDDAAAWVQRYAAAVRGGDAALLARSLRFEAELSQRSGDLAGADRLLRQALDTYKVIPSRSGTAATLEQWAALLAAQQQWAAAEDRLQRALNIRLWLLDRSATAGDLRRLAAINEATGRQDRMAALARWADIVAGDGAVDWSALRREVIPY